MRTQVCGVFLVVLTVAGCATASKQVVPQFADRVGVPERPDATVAVALPPGVALDDGLTQDEAVAIALWNNAEFRTQLTQLGFARADLVEAGLLRNPILSLLFPIGPKQLEATLKWPIEVLWERPKRVAAARLAVERGAVGLEQNGLDLAASVKVAYVDFALARDRSVLAEAAASQVADIRRLTQSRLDAGDISELEARLATVEAARAREVAVRARFDLTLRGNDLRGRLGLALDPMELELPAEAAYVPACPMRPNLLEEALASRPDVRAAEIAIEEAGRRLGWERSRIVTIAAVLDANAEGIDGFESGPGVDIGAPLFDRNQGGRARATVEMQRAMYAYSAVRQRVATELRDALTQSEQADAALAALRDAVLRPLETQVRGAERAYEEGDVSYLFVLETIRSLTDARLRIAEAEADLSRARARTERALGANCGRTATEVAGAR